MREGQEAQFRKETEKDLPSHSLSLRAAIVKQTVVCDRREVTVRQHFVCVCVVGGHTCSFMSVQNVWSLLSICVRGGTTCVCVLVCF